MNGGSKQRSSCAASGLLPAQQLARKQHSLSAMQRRVLSTLGAASAADALRPTHEWAIRGSGASSSSCYQCHRPRAPGSGAWVIGTANCLQPVAAFCLTNPDDAQCEICALAWLCLWLPKGGCLSASPCCQPGSCGYCKTAAAAQQTIGLSCHSMPINELLASNGTPVLIMI
jgi:hypothetical protein